MSAEVENSKEEETKEQQQKKTNKEKFLENWQLGIKILELLICAGCIGFVYEPARAIGLGKNHLHHFGLMYTSFTGFLLINLVLLIARAIGDRIPYRTSLLICCCGSALYLITAILLSIDINEVKRKSFHPNQYRQIMMFTTAVLSWVNMGVFGIEGLVTWRRKQDF